MSKQITIGDIVKLKEPYSVEETETYQFGIVVQKLSVQSFSLHLFNEDGKLYIYPEMAEVGLMIPTYVDFHDSEILLYKRAKELGYKTS